MCGGYPNGGGHWPGKFEDVAPFGQNRGTVSYNTCQRIYRRSHCRQRDGGSVGRDLGHCEYPDGGGHWGAFVCGAIGGNL